MSAGWTGGQERRAKNERRGGANAVMAAAAAGLVSQLRAHRCAAAKAVSFISASIPEGGGRRAQRVSVGSRSRAVSVGGWRLSGGVDGQCKLRFEPFGGRAAACWGAPCTPQHALNSPDAAAWAPPGSIPSTRSRCTAATRHPGLQKRSCTQWRLEGASPCMRPCSSRQRAQDQRGAPQQGRGASPAACARRHTISAAAAASPPPPPPTAPPLSVQSSSRPRPPPRRQGQEAGRAAAQGGGGPWPGQVCGGGGQAV